MIEHVCFFVVERGEFRTVKCVRDRQPKNAENKPSTHFSFNLAQLSSKLFHAFSSYFQPFDAFLQFEKIILPTNASKPWMFHFIYILGKCVEDLFGMSECGGNNMPTKCYIIEHGRHDFIHKQKTAKTLEFCFFGIFSKWAYLVFLMCYSLKYQQNSRIFPLLIGFGLRFK